jgi:CarD family transcriptional regulator
LPKKATVPSKSAAEKPAQPKPAALRPVPTPAATGAPAFQKKPMRPPLPAAPPRLAEVAPAEEVDYAEGDYVVYPTHGVGRVTGIEQQVISGHKLRLIAIKFEKDRMTLRVPVAKAQESGLRKLSTRKVMDSALAALKGRVRIKRTMWSRRAQEYEAKINSGDPVSIAEVVRDLHRGSDQPDQSYSERQMYQAALDRLAREFAAVEKIDEATAAERLEELLKAA